MDKGTGKGKSIVPQLKMLTYIHLLSLCFKSIVIQQLIVIFLCGAPEGGGA